MPSPVYVSERELLNAVAEGYARQRGHDTLPPTWERALATLVGGRKTASFDFVGAAIVNELCQTAAVDVDDHAAPGFAFEVRAAIAAAERIVTDLQNVIASLSTVESQHTIPEWRWLTWRPVVTGLGEWRLEVELRPSRGWIKRSNGRFLVNQSGFDQVSLETFEEACDLLLQREWSARKAARVQAALAERRAILSADNAPAEVPA